MLPKHCSPALFPSTVPQHCSPELRLKLKLRHNPEIFKSAAVQIETLTTWKGSDTEIDINGTSIEKHSKFLAKRAKSLIMEE